MALSQKKFNPATGKVRKSAEESKSADVRAAMCGCFYVCYSLIGKVREGEVHLA